MKAKIQITNTEHSQQDSLLAVFLVIVCSFAIGSIPIIYGLGNASTDNSISIVPTEAALWDGIVDKGQ